MTIETVLTINHIMLAVSVIALCILMGLLIRSERKLAKYNESWFFKRKGGK